jgi:predicted DNA-binding protein with PD1-like motif
MEADMRSQALTAADGRTFALVFDQGEEVADGLLRSAREHEVRAASFTAIGALQDVVLGYWDREIKDYREIPIREQVEVLSLVGNIALAQDGTPRVHAHVVVRKSDGSAHGGHLLEGHVLPTLEIVLEESPAILQRKTDPDTGLALLVLDRS